MRVFCVVAGLFRPKYTWLLHALYMPVKKNMWWTHGDFHMYGYISHLVIFCRLALDLGHQILALELEHIFAGKLQISNGIYFSRVHTKALRPLLICGFPEKVDSLGILFLSLCIQDGRGGGTRLTGHLFCFFIQFLFHSACIVFFCDL